MKDDFDAKFDEAAKRLLKTIESMDLDFEEFITWMKKQKHKEVMK